MNLAKDSCLKAGDLVYYRGLEALPTRGCCLFAYQQFKGDVLIGLTTTKADGAVTACVCAPGLDPSSIVIFRQFKNGRGQVWAKGHGKQVPEFNTSWADLEVLLAEGEVALALDKYPPEVDYTDGVLTVRFQPLPKVAYDYKGRVYTPQLETAPQAEPGMPGGQSAEDKK